jgi:hypothetical protein
MAFRLEWWPEDNRAQLCEMCQEIKGKPVIRLYTHISVATPMVIWLHEGCLTKAMRQGKGRWEKAPDEDCGVVVR